MRKSIFAIPKEPTIHLCAITARKTLDIFSAALKQEGVSEEVISKAVSHIQGDLKKTVSVLNDDYRDKIEKLLERRKNEDRRKDYFGRALLYKLDDKFPVDEDTNTLVLTELVEGVIPREVCEGLIKAIKSSLGEEELEEWEKITAEIAEIHRSKTDSLIDVHAFLADPKIQEIVNKTLGKFSHALENRDEESRKAWLRQMIESTDAFKRMKRDIMGSEYEQILKYIF